MLLPVTALYTALLAIVGLVLTGLVGRLRPKFGISLGDGGHRELIEANRRHMNYVEQVPLALILLAVVEINGASSLWLHALGGTLLAGRLIHPFGIDATNMKRLSRLIGASLTMLVTFVLLVMALWQHFS